MHAWEIDEDIRSALWSIDNVRKGRLDQNLDFLLGKIYSIVDYASGHIGDDCEYDPEKNVIKDSVGRVRYDKDGIIDIDDDD